MVQSKSERGTFLTIGLCLMVAVFEGIDLQAAGLAVPQIRGEFHLIASQIGYFTAASSVGLLLGALGGGRLADKIGRRFTLTLALVLFGLASIATALSPSLEVLIATRFVTGVGLGGALPNLVALANENSPASWKSRAVAIMYAGFPFGGALASALMFWAATPGSALNGLIGPDWRTIFYIGGLAPLLAVPLVNFVLPDSVEFARSKQSGGSSAGLFEVVFGGGRALNSILLWISFFTTLMVLYLLLNWLPALLTSRGFDRDQSFLVQLMFNAGGVPGSIIAGVLMDRGGRRLTVPVLYAGLVLCLILMAGMPTDIGFAVLYGTLVGIFVMATQGLLYGLAPVGYGTLIRGTGVGAAVCMGRIGSVAGPLFAGRLVGAGHTASQVLMAIVPFAVVGGLTAVAVSARLKGQPIVRTAPAE